MILDPAIETRTGTGTDVLLEVPNTSNGERLIAIVQIASGSDVTVTPPSGWNLLIVNGWNPLLTVYVYQRESNSEPANYTWTLSSLIKWVGAIMSYPGADFAGRVVSRVSEYSVRDFQTESFTPDKPNSRLLVIASQLSPAIWGTVVDWTIQATQRSGINAKVADMSLGLFDRQLGAVEQVPVATFTAAVNGECLYFQRDAGVLTTDGIIKGYFADYGFTVTTIDQDEDTAVIEAAAANAALTFCSPSIFSSRGIKLENITSPLLIAKAFSADNLGMSGSIRGTDYDLTENPFLTDYSVVDVTHPLAAGLSGSIQPYTDNQGRATWSNPHNLAGAALAFKDTNETRYFQYGLEPGYIFIDGSTTKPARWTFNFADSGFNFSAQGEALIKAAIDYTVRAVPSPEVLTMIEIEAFVSPAQFTERIASVEAEDRIASVEVENRTATVSLENRTFTL